MVRRVSLGELRASGGRLADDCRREGEPCVVTRRGKPLGVLIPWSEHVEGWLAAWETGAQTELPLDASPKTEPSRAEAQSGVASALADQETGLDYHDLSAMDSATWGQWSEMSDEDRAAMVLADSLIRGRQRTGAAPAVDSLAGWGALARSE